PSTAGNCSTGRKRSREQTPTAQPPAHLSLKPQVQQQSPSSPWPGLQSAGFSRSGRRYTNINSPLSGSGTPAAAPGSLWQSGKEGLGKRPARRGRRLAAMQDQAAEHHRGVEQQARRPTSNAGGAKAQGIAAQLLSGLLPARPAAAVKGHRASRQAEKAQTSIPAGPQGQNASTDRPQAQPLQPPAPLLQPQPRRKPQSKRGEAGSGLENQAASHHPAVEPRETGPPSMATPRQQGPGPPKRGHHSLRQAAGAGCVRPRRQLSPSCRAAWFAPPPQPSGITSWGHRSGPDAAGALPGAGVLGRMNPSHRSQQALKGPLMEPLAIGQGQKAVQLSNGHGAECRKKQPGASLLGKQAKRREGEEGGEVEANGRADDHGLELHEDMLSLGPSGGMARNMQGKRNRNSVAARSQQGPLRSRQPREDSEAAGNSAGARSTKRVRHEAVRADATGTANGRLPRKNATYTALMVVSWSDAGGLSTQNSSRPASCSALYVCWSQACLFPHTARFTRDGTTREDRLPNFLNGRDAQANELPPHYDGSVNTNTHTTVTDRLPSTKAVQELSASVEKSLWSLPSMKSTRDKTVTVRSYLANDPRFELVKDPYPEPLGPGQYEVENGVPGIGPLPFGQPSRTTSPGRDPGRHSAAFVSPARPPLFSAADSPDRVYVGPDALPLNDKGVAWHLAKDQRAPVADYRYATRLNDARREVPADININSRQLSAASKPTQVGDQAHLHAASKVPFTSKEPRLDRHRLHALICLLPDYMVPQKRWALWGLLAVPPPGPAQLEEATAQLSSILSLHDLGRAVGGKPRQVGRQYKIKGQGCPAVRLSGCAA
ncbi:hypothetical protein QJQ45_023259, partial [Haematococcus lacustris]